MFNNKRFLHKVLVATLAVGGFMLTPAISNFSFLSIAHAEENSYEDKIDAAKVAIFDKDYKKAFNLYKEIIKLNPNDYRGYDGLALCYAIMNNRERAIEKL